MKHNNFLIKLILMAILAIPFFYVPDVSAAVEQATEGRKLWDNIMLFINFGILVFLFLKFARKPLMDYLRSIRTKIEKDMNNVNGRLHNVKSNMEEAQEKLKSVDQYIQDIRDSILEMGKREKEKIINDGKLLAEKMIQDAKAYSEYKITAARKELLDEMVDISVSIAGEKLREKISEEDNENLINQFITNLQTAK